MLLRFVPSSFTIALLVWLRLQDAALASALFVLSAALPIASLAAWLDEREKERRGALCALFAAGLPFVCAALCWGGFSSGNPPATHLGSVALLGASLAVSSVGFVELGSAFGARRSSFVAAFAIAWSLLLAAPFFLPSYAGVQLGLAGEAEIASRVVSVHPFAAACDAVGGLDGFRHPALYAHAEIGARHAYRYPSSTVYSAALCGIALAGAAARFARIRRVTARALTP